MIRKVWTVLAGAVFAASMGAAAHAGELNSQAATPSIIGSLDVASYSTLTPETMGRTVGTATADATATARGFGPGNSMARTATSAVAVYIPNVGHASVSNSESHAMGR